MQLQSQIPPQREALRKLFGKSDGQLPNLFAQLAFLNHFAWRNHFAASIPDPSSKRSLEEAFGKSDGKLPNGFGQLAFSMHFCQASNCGYGSNAAMRRLQGITLGEGVVFLEFLQTLENRNGNPSSKP